ncbi:SDR family oxidoreductase [Chitinophaga nivalis]|uniref:SDR family oxidoreductase n=1 Tax=Chitinophaga nivalis TaxID=2991709 RepID=A0ABT3ITK2_9BACT|nr:SDR family oxidoreductase [Chitinophaga nivalis]MCW3463012.1 SDR family oxidoreductase [Chitinophaga nivalis]MCW3487298.1 SDR family oxidoreductase [Chitinophaga nivalis]
MKILLTGATGYIGQRLLPVLLENGHEIICCVRDKTRFNADKYLPYQVKVITVNFSDKTSLENIPVDIDVAYYLLHSMAAAGNFSAMEETAALHFRERLQQTKVQQVIYLGGIINETNLSAHLQSRKNVEHILAAATFPLTTLRAGIIVGSGSTSFEIMRGLVEKLPVMFVPRWVYTTCQPIAIRNVVELLQGVLLLPTTYQQCYDIGGTDILTYKEMLLRLAAVRGLRRKIWVVPLLTLRYSSWWVYLLTAASFPLALNLARSMTTDMICRPNSLAAMLGVKLLSYDTALSLAFDKIAQNQVLSSWQDTMTSPVPDKSIPYYREVPLEGCFKDVRKIQVTNIPQTTERIWAIGGRNGWYYANWLWTLRGFIDKLAGGVGMRRASTTHTTLAAGDVLDCWRVIFADKANKQLLLYAEMKLPGEAWLSFEITGQQLTQTAVFRPRGITGRLYWYAMWPFHAFIFPGMIRRIGRQKRAVTV